MEFDDGPEGRTAAERPQSLRTTGAESLPRARPRRTPQDREPRYRLRRELGRGGMGEVHLARDERIGRTVALKVMLDETAGVTELQRRFLREARVQAQLEHPAVVPVHDLDWDDEGRAYFVMKRISGVTLREVLAALRSGDPHFQATYTTHRLLALFQQACLAIDCAHSHGVVHRDIKPSNLMLGDFGEVYVLDWGIARVFDDPTDEEDRGPTSRVELAREQVGATGHGDILGTLGYMAPEQLADAHLVDRRADVYSLGAVLFEILALQTLHRGPSDAERERSTLGGIDARPSLRAPERDVPLELDAICVRATALDPAERYDGARALHDAIQSFLEGDRDTRLRAQMAAEHVREAKEYAQRALIDGPEAFEQRKMALQHAGRALALDASDADAAAILARLRLEPPKELPPEVVAATRSQRLEEMRRGVRMSAVTLAVFTVAAVIGVWGSVRSWPGLAAIVAPLILAIVYGVIVSYSRPKSFRFHAVALIVPVTLAIAGGTGLLGPLLLIPMFGLAVGALVSNLDGLGNARLPMLAMCCAASTVPALLEWAGLISSSYAFHDGTVTILPRILNFSETEFRAVLTAGNLIVIVFVCALGWRYASWVGASRERMQLYAWHLENLAPKEPPTREPPPDEPGPV